MTSLNQELSRLNVEQQQAVDELDRNILLLASAGTGKTNTLAYRLAEIIKKKKAKPEEILCLTFTNRACTEIRERIVPIVGKDAFKITVKTFHSFCYSIIREEAKAKTDLADGFLIVDEEDCKEVLRELVGDSFNTGLLQGFVNYIKEQSMALGHKDYHRIVAEAHYNNPPSIEKWCEGANYKLDRDMLSFVLSSGGALIRQYNGVLRERNTLDFVDLLVMASEILKDAECLRKWSARFKYIHIDEVQDTSEVEYGIISPLFKNNIVMLCGDSFQTIYEWRGSTPKRVLGRFVADCAPVTIILNINYRATKRLLRASYAYLESAFTTEVKRIYPSEVVADSLEEGNNIALKNAVNTEDEARWIFRKITALKVEDVSKIAILTRNNYINVSLSQCFSEINAKLPESERLKFMLVDDYRFFRRQEIKDILAYLKLLINRHDVNSCKRILLRFAHGIGEKTIEDVESNSAKELGIRLTDFLDHHTYVYGDPYRLLWGELGRGNVVVFDVESTGIDTALDEIIQIAAVKINSKGEILAQFKEFLKPARPVGNSQYVHGFDDAFLSEVGKEPKAVLQAFAAFIGGSLVTGHNVGYDLSILHSQLARLGLPAPQLSGSVDTLDMARRFYPDLPNHKLATLSEYLAVTTKPTHEAWQDVLATKDILLHILKEKIEPLMPARAPFYQKQADKFVGIRDCIAGLKEKSRRLRPYQLIDEIIKSSNIKTVYARESRRLENIDEFCKLVKSLDQPEVDCRDALLELLKIASLSNSELDRVVKKYPQIPIVTVHQAKGTEFDYVFVAGLQDNTFPSYPAIKAGCIAEEKRVFYVAITRAKKQLFLSWSKNDGYKLRQISRFIGHIPERYIDKT